MIWMIAQRMIHYFAALPQTCIDVPAERLDRQLGLQRQQLGLSPHGRCADAHPRSKLRSAAKRVASILSVEVGAYGEAVGVGRGHVLGRMDGDVDPPGEQRLLDLLDEHAARADLAERLRPVFVARGRDRDERDLDTVAPQPIGRELGLRQREPATAAADPDQAQG